MVRVAIVEDEVTYSRQLIDYLTKYQKERQQELSVVAFGDGDEILESYRSQYDIILMDVKMRFLDGMSTAEEIRKKDSEVVIIFITSMAQYAIRGYAVDALDYVLKPVSYFAFSQRLERAIERMSHRTRKYICITNKDGVQKVDIAELRWVESQGHTLVFHAKSGEYRMICAMNDAEERLREYHFFRGNKGYLINLACVDGVVEDNAIVAGQPLLLSRSRKKAFMEAMTDYLGGVIK